MQFKGAYRKKTVYATSLTALLVSQSLWSEEGMSDETAMLFSLSIEQLIQVQVTTPSRSSQSVEASPGVVSVITAREIELFGARDLGEVLSRFLGFDEYGTLSNGRNSVTVRGDQASSNNNHVLFLLNGIPLNRESYTGGIWNEAMLVSIPLQSIDRLELTRGPGSVLYGTNAFAGVVNIFTKTADEQESSLSVGVGNQQSRALDLTGAGTQGEWQWTSSLRLYDTEGWGFETNDLSGQTFKRNAESTSPGFLGSLAKNGFKSNFYWGKADQFTTRGSPFGLEAATTDNEKYSVNMSYTYEADNQWALTGSLSYVAGRTKHKVSSAIPGQLNTIRYKTDDYRFEGLARGRMGKGDVLLGATVDYFTGATPLPFKIVDDWNDKLYGVFGQYEITHESTKYFLGFQYNQTEENNSVVPRLGLIHNLSPNSGLKLLYGQAFRSPSVVERTISVSIPNLSLKGDEGLDAETVTTYDLQYYYSKDNISASVTLFRNKQIDLIDRQMVEAGSFVFANTGTLVIEGLEFEAKYIREGWYFTGSYAYQENENGEGVTDVTFQPDHRLKLGVGYASDRWSIGVFNNYNSNYQNNFSLSGDTPSVNALSESFNRLSANIVYRPSGESGWRFQLYLDNILGETSRLPPISGDPLSALGTAPVLADRFALLTATLSFN